MSGSEFERENIVTETLSATAASKAADIAREHTWRPPAEGLYDLSMEKDSCGVGFIANIKGKKSHQIVSDAINILCNLEHRGAVGADPRAGDGAGILVQIPHKFFARKAKALGITLPKPGEYGIGALFMPRDADRRELVRRTFEQIVAQEGLTILGWRSDMPVDNSTLGETVKPTEPFHMQVFIGKGKKNLSEDEFDRAAGLHEVAGRCDSGPVHVLPSGRFTSSVGAPALSARSHDVSAEPAVSSVTVPVSPVTPVAPVSPVRPVDPVSPTVVRRQRRPALSRIDLAGGRDLLHALAGPTARGLIRSTDVLGLATPSL